MLALRYYRLKRGWTQQTLADQVQSNQPRISNIEQGLLKPDDALLDRLATALGMRPAFALLRPVIVRDHAVIADSGEEVKS